MSMYSDLLYLGLLASALSCLIINNVAGSCSEDQSKCDDGSCVSIEGTSNSTLTCQHTAGAPPHQPRASRPRRNTRQAQKDMCVLPEYPANGTYSTHIPNAKPADVYELVTVNVTCARGFALIGSAATFCLRGVWSEPMPTCVSQCHLPSHPSVIYRCLIPGRVKKYRACEEYEIHGTVVSPQCRSPYYYSAVVLTRMQCVDGNWNYTAKCSPECGKVSSIGKPLVVDGVSARRAEVPWHAGVYSKSTDPYKQICGGSLVTNNVILSAAHCFWIISEGKQLPAADYAVAVGKLHRPWGDDEHGAQRSDVAALHLPPLFQGSAANNQEDIAVVVATTPFRFSTFVRPVCLDFDKFLQNTQLTPGNMGKVAGWGLTSVNGTSSHDLKVVDLPVVATETCVADAPVSFRGFINSDKICAGFQNENRGVCKGDSGGGLAFPETDERDVPRFYLRGIVSTAPTSDQLCNADSYTTFTQILIHEQFIKQFLEKGEPCQLKPHRSVEYHCVSFGNVGSSRPCTVVRPRCRGPGYHSATALSLMTCVDGNWNYIARCSPELPCKEESFGYNETWFTPPYAMDDEKLNHVTVKRDSADLLEYFEMHVAIEADEHMSIWLRDKKDFSDSNNRFYIDVGIDSNLFTTLKYQETTIAYVSTPGILSSPGFTTFYIKLTDGKLEFGEENDTNPLISHYDERLKSVKYFGFYYGWENRARIRYDCPHTNVSTKVST